MKYKALVFTLFACITFLGSCAEETCPTAFGTKPEYSFRKKTKVKYHTKRKPTPSLIHVTRVNYKPNNFK